MIDSPALILSNWLANELIGVNPELDSSSDWPIYTGNLPDHAGIKDKALAVYDTAGTKDGRIQRTGETVEHQGLQFRIRANSYEEGYAKAGRISEALDNLYKAPVIANDRLYTVHAIHRNPILTLGPEPDGRRRHEFTVNAIVTIEIGTAISSNLLAWFDASDISTVPVYPPISVWQNKYGSDWLYQYEQDWEPTYILAGQNGLNIIRSYGVEYLSTENPIPDWRVDDYSLFFVAKHASDGALISLEANAASGFLSGTTIYFDDGDIRVRTASSDLTSYDIAAVGIIDANWHIYSLTKDGPDMEIYKDGTLVASASGAPQAINFHSFGRTSVDAVLNKIDPASDIYSTFFGGDLGEWLLYENKKPDPIREYIENNLMSKWGIGGLGPLLFYNLITGDGDLIVTGDSSELVVL